MAGPTGQKKRSPTASALRSNLETRSPEKAYSSCASSHPFRIGNDFEFSVALSGLAFAGHAYPRVDAAGLSFFLLFGPGLLAFA